MTTVKMVSQSQAGSLGGGFEIVMDDEVGQLTGSYPCMYGSTSGQLLVGTEAVSFIGFVFFFERRVDIEWASVLNVVKNEEVRSVSFVLREGGTVYDFTNIPNCERVWASLVSIHNQSIYGTSTTSMMQAPVRGSIRRSLSDPNLSSSIAPLASVGTQDGLTEAEIALLRQSASAMPASQKLAPSGRRQSLMMSGTPSLKEEEEEKEEVVNLEVEWKELRAGGQGSYAQTAIEERPFACDLDTFFETFLSDSAPHSFQEYMESTGDKDIVVPEWEQEDPLVYKRVVQYTHPISAPMAPPEARARKEQRYRRYGNHGISVEIDTFVEDVPKTDCFYVTDRILIESSENGVVVLAQFDVRFVKSTMFRRLIEGTSRGEFLKWYQGLEVYWTRSLATDAEVPERRKSTAIETVLVQEKEEQPKEEKAIPVVVSPTQMVMFGVMGMIVLLQLWMILELRCVKSTMAAMQLNGNTCPGVLDSDGDAME